MTRLHGNCAIAAAGRHVINDPLFVFERTAPLTDAHIHIGTSHIITVQPGEVGLAFVNGRPHFLEPVRCACGCSARALVCVCVWFVPTSDRCLMVCVVVRAGHLFVAGQAHDQPSPVQLHAVRAFHDGAH